MTTQSIIAAARTPFRVAGIRTAASPTAALAQAIDGGTAGVERCAATRLSPRLGSFDPPTAAVLLTWREA